MATMTWQVYLALSDTYFDGCDIAYPSDDAFDHATSMDLDTITASQIDPVAYREIDACASLDDDIEAMDR